MENESHTKQRKTNDGLTMERASKKMIDKDNIEGHWREKRRRHTKQYYSHQNKERHNHEW